MAEKEVGEPLSGPLVLRRTGKDKPGAWGPDDYEVIQDGCNIGRLFKPRPACRWITLGYGPSLLQWSRRVCRHTDSASLEETKADAHRTASSRVLELLCRDAVPILKFLAGRN